jgi:alkylation response protein AidB-like acyl-CoA dehydrogenase
VDINLDDDQLELGRIARSFFETRFPMASVRESEGSEVGYSPDVWREMASLDWLRLGYPDSDGGAGGGLLELTVIYQALGRTLAPVPHLEAAVISAGLLHAAGSDRHRSLLEQLWAGETLVVPALAEPEDGYGPDAVSLVATNDGSGGLTLTGAKLLVPWANSASHFIVAVRTSPSGGSPSGGSPSGGSPSGGGAAGISLVLVPAGTDGMSLSRLDNIAGLPLFALEFDSVAVGADTLVGARDAGWDLLGPQLDRAAVLRAAQIQGAAERLLEYSVDYSINRSQFGQSIGQYQAVQYLCSDIAINSHLTALYTRVAAGLIDAGEPAVKAVSQAKAQANLTARLAPERAHAVHAGIAFMLDFDVQLFTRRCRHWELDAGDERYHRERIAAALAERAPAGAIG